MRGLVCNGFSRFSRFSSILSSLFSSLSLLSNRCFYLGKFILGLTVETCCTLLTFNGISTSLSLGTSSSTVVSSNDFFSLGFRLRLGYMFNSVLNDFTVGFDDTSLACTSKHTTHTTDQQSIDDFLSSALIAMLTQRSISTSYRSSTADCASNALTNTSIASSLCTETSYFTCTSKYSICVREATNKGSKRVLGSYTLTEVLFRPAIEFVINLGLGTQILKYLDTVSIEIHLMTVLLNSLVSNLEIIIGYKVLQGFISSFLDVSTHTEHGSTKGYQGIRCFS